MSYRGRHSDEFDPDLTRSYNPVFPEEREDSPEWYGDKESQKGKRVGMTLLATAGILLLFLVSCTAVRHIANSGRDNKTGNSPALSLPTETSPGNDPAAGSNPSGPQPAPTVTVERGGPTLTVQKPGATTTVSEPPDTVTQTVTTTAPGTTTTKTSTVTSQPQVKPGPTVTVTKTVYVYKRGPKVVVTITVPAVVPQTPPTP